MRKKLFFIFALLCLTVTSTWAQTVASGTCGVDDPATNNHDESQDVTWKLTGTESNYTLTISGTGDMADYNNEPPGWDGYKEKITSIVIGEGVTSIGICAFKDCSGLTTITIPACVKRIEGIAFKCCSNLTSVYVLRNELEGQDEEKITTLGNDAFEGCHSDLVIYVPSVDSYKIADNWNYFYSDNDENNKLKAFNGYCGTSVVWYLTGTSSNYTLTIAGTHRGA